MSRYPYHLGRTVQWGHWGITFLDRQPDLTKNFGVVAGQISFPVGTRGPCDLPRKAEYQAMCRDWIERGELPC